MQANSWHHKFSISICPRLVRKQTKCKKQNKKKQKKQKKKKKKKKSKKIQHGKY